MYKNLVFHIERIVKNDTNNLIFTQYAFILKSLNL